MRHTCIISLVVPSALAVVALTACGSGTGAPRVVAHVASAPITHAELTRQEAVLAGGRSSDASRLAAQTRASRALEELIASRWTVAEAERRGLAPSDADVRAHVEARRAAEFPGGAGEWRAFLRDAGETVAGVEAETRTELAAQALRNATLKSLAPVTPVDVAAYYASHKWRYAVPPRREIEITNRKTAALADRVKREVAAGRSFASLATREIVSLPGRPGEPYGRDHLDPAIASARVGVLSGPVKHRVDYFVFEVKRVRPPGIRPLTSVRAAIATQLLAERRRRASVRFLAEWQARWRVETTCARGHVVRGCAEDRSSQLPAARFELP